MRAGQKNVTPLPALHQERNELSRCLANIPPKIRKYPKSVRSAAKLFSCLARGLRKALFAFAQKNAGMQTSKKNASACNAERHSSDPYPLLHPARELFAVGSAMRLRIRSRSGSPL